MSEVEDLRLRVGALERGHQAILARLARVEGTEIHHPKPSAADAKADARRMTGADRGTNVARSNEPADRGANFGRPAERGNISGTDEG